MKPFAYLRTRRGAVLGFVALLAAYVASYAAMSAAGSWMWSQTGKTRYAMGFSATDVVRWKPVAAYWEPFRSVSGADTSRGNLLGYIYSPLIRIDRAIIHRESRYDSYPKRISHRCGAQMVTDERQENPTRNLCPSVPPIRGKSSSAVYDCFEVQAGNEFDDR